MNHTAETYLIHGGGGMIGEQVVREHGSAAVTREAYPYDEIRVGAAVAWIFNNENLGYRIK
jgi:hypothetical protein